MAALHVRFQALSQLELLRTARALEIADGDMNDTVMPVEIRLVGKIATAKEAWELFRKWTWLDGRTFLFIDGVRWRGRYRRWFQHLLMLLSEQCGMVWVGDNGNECARGWIEKRWRRR